MLDQLLALLASLNWTDAILGVVVGGGATTLRVGWSTLWNRRPLRQFLADLADDSKILSIFVREMVSQDNKYYSDLPTGGIQTWQNFPVVGLTDVEAVTDVLNLLGQAGRVTNIAWRKVASESGLWDEPQISVGGSFKTDRILEICMPKYVVYQPPDTFVVSRGPVFIADATHDYGLIAKVRHPQTGVSCLVLFGFGMAGTAAAGRFFRRHAAHLARVYGSRPFALILRVGWHDGSASAEPAWMSSNAATFLPIVHPLVWWKYRSLLSGRVA